MDNIFPIKHYLSVSFGLLTVFLTTVSPSLRNPVAGKVKYFILGFSCTSFGSLVLTVLAVGSEFVGSLIVLAFLPIAIAVVVWLAMELMQGHQNGQLLNGENELGTSSIIITTFIFAVIMAVYAKDFTGGHYGFNLRAYMFLMSIAFMSSLSWILQVLNDQITRSLEMVIKVLIGCTILVLALAMVDLICLDIYL